MSPVTNKRKRSKSVFVKDSPFINIQNEVQQHPKLRQKLIGKIERLFDAKVITFFTSFTKPGAMIADVDAEMLESILAVEQDKGKVILILNSAGGQGLAAERIVNVCRSYSGGCFEVIVPHMAKSAATMICFGASQVHMSRTAELGPVDPQMSYKDDKGNDYWISAEEYVRSYDHLMSEASSGKHQRIEVYLQQLQRYDSRLVEQLKSAQKLSGDISVRLLKSGMMSNKSDDEIRKAVEIFLSQQRTSSHGRMITYDEATTCGLKTQLIDLQSDPWDVIWELYVRSNWVVSTQSVKLIESATSAVSA